ncbi:MAG: hypothetical protein L3K07_01420 [Thermoplasmata archaeon]|nr:hypothetical protein [Thermoplasmata archaeon]
MLFSMRPWRTIRQRRRRSRKGQVSAVGVLLGLLLVTVYIANYLGTTLPSQMQELEFEHELQVENQLGKLQAIVNAQALHGGYGFGLTSPVTLGSGALPPFAPASTGSIGPDVGKLSASLPYRVVSVSTHPPNWNITPSCPPTGSPCHGTSWDNITGTPNQTYTFKFNGGAPVMNLNFTGNNDTIILNWLGKSASGSVFAIFNGSNLHVTLNKGSSGGGDSPSIGVFFFGQHDVYEMNLNGAGMTANVDFYGSLNRLCPEGNLSNTDAFYWNNSGPSATNVNATWFNSAGYNNVNVIPLGAGTTLTFRNESTFPGGCAWSSISGSTFHPSFSSGILVHLNDRYIPAEDIAYDQGAVIVNHPGVGSIMDSPPQFTVGRIAGGLTMNLTLVNIVMNQLQEEGVATAGVTTRVVSEFTYTITTNVSQNRFLDAVYLNVSTPYPAAWASFFNGLPAGLLTGSPQCIPQQPVFAPATCLAPRAGALETVSVLFNVAQLTLTQLNLAVTIS